MSVQRFSAVGNFGIPLDNPNNLDRQGVLSLLDNYGIEGEEIDTELTDITPYYFRDPVYRYLLSRKSLGNAAVVDMMPVYNDSMSIEMGAIGSINYVAKSPLRSIEIPTHQETFLLAGPGPRFVGQLCIHEVIVEV